MPKQRANIVAVLDLGSSKIVCFIAKVNTNNKIEILGIGHYVSSGIKAGIITDIKAVQKAITQAIIAAESTADESIQKIHIAVSSNSLLSHRLCTEIIVTGHEINDKDLNKLLYQALDRYNEQDIEVIHSFAYDYMLDGNRGITSPLGMYGHKLAADFHIIAGQASALLNIANCAARCQLEVEGYICSSFASGLACLSDDEMSLGVTLIEFGGSCTSISIFNCGNLIFTDGISLGGINVTNDIAKGLCTDFANAERVKIMYGNVVLTPSDERKVIEVPISSDEDAEMNVVSQVKLVEIIRARTEEILEILKLKLVESGIESLSGNKIVITGGGAQLSGIRELVTHIFSKTVRFGYPKNIDGLNDNVNGVAFSSAIGMLYNLSSYENDPFGLQNKKDGVFSNLLQWIKQNFA